MGYTFPYDSITSMYLIKLYSNNDVDDNTIYLLIKKEIKQLTGSYTSPRACSTTISANKVYYISLYMKKMRKRNYYETYFLGYFLFFVQMKILWKTR